MKKGIGTLPRKIWSQLKQNWWGALLGVILAGGAGWLLYSTVLGQKLIFRSYDIPFSVRPNIPADEIVLVYMDEQSHRVLEQPLNAPWDRGVHAALIRRLSQAGAKAIAFDIVFSDPFPDERLGPFIDQDFAEALEETGNVILAADYVSSSSGFANQLVPPYDPFSKNAAAIGTAEMNPDDDLVIRQHLLEHPTDPYFTLSWVAATQVKAAVTQDPKLHFKERWVNYYGPDGSLPSLPYYKIMVDDEFKEIPSGYFSNKVVFVGARTFTKFSNERKDAYPTPYPFQKSGNRFMPGVEIQATVFLNLLRNEWLNRLPRGLEKYIIITIGMLFGVGLLLCRPVVAVLLAATGIAVISIGHYYMFSTLRYWFPWMIIVVAQIPIAAVWSVTFNSIQLYVQRRLLIQSLSAYLSPKRVNQLVSRGDQELLKPGAEKQMLTILFSDIENFTVLSEDIDSDDLAKLMNRYFENAVTNCIFKTDGTVVKYIGDAIFSFWNAPEEQQDHSVKACEAAFLLSSQSITFEKQGQERRFRTRVGLHTGVANVGNFGSATRVDYTAIGENINLASRMEGLNKYLGTTVLITGDTKAGLGDRLITRFCGKFILKGFEKAVDVHELVARPDAAEASKAWREAFEAALKQFQKKDFDAAEQGFRCVLQLRPEDGPSKYYLKEILELRANPPGPDWQGEIELKEK